MIFENYKKWLEGKMLKGLSENSVLVVDNAPYHNKQLENCTNPGSRKEEMRQGG